MATATKINLWLKKTGSPTGIATVSLYESDDNNVNNGVSKASGTISAASISSLAVYSVSISYTLQADKYYFIVIDNGISYAIGNYVQWYGNYDGEDSDSYRSSDNGASWDHIYTGKGYVTYYLTDSGNSTILGNDEFGETQSSIIFSGVPNWWFSSGDYLYEEEQVPEQATNQTPADESDGWATTYETLSWEDGGEGEDNAATSYDVYFKKGFLGSFEKVAEGIAETSLSMPDHVGTELNELTEYTWRVDSINEAGTTTGDEWTFITSGVRGVGKARDPVPSDEATDQSVNLSSLSFGDGEGATSYNVYFGLPDNLSLLGNVEYASQEISLAYQSLLANTTYNWRVDSVGALGGVVTGDVWEFTTTSDFHPPDPTSGGPDDGTNSAFVTTRKLIAAAKNSIYIEDI